MGQWPPWGRGGKRFKHSLERANGVRKRLCDSRRKHVVFSLERTIAATDVSWIADSSNPPHLPNAAHLSYAHCVQLARTKPHENPYGNVNVAVAVDDCNVPASVACAVGKFTTVISVGDCG